MTMPESQVSFISSVEKEFIDRINQRGVSIDRATVAVYLYFNRIIKPKEELEQILINLCPTILYSEENHTGIVSKAIEWMINEGLAQNTFNKSLDTPGISVSDDFPEKMEQLTQSSGIADDLRKKYESFDLPVIVEPKGIVGRREENYSEMITHIQLAHNSIKYAVLTTPTYPVTVNALIAAAKRGVKVQVLVASEKITRAYKNQPSVAAEWKSAFKDIANAQVKIFEDEQAGELCSSIIIDDKILRLDIYDFRKIRSLNGYLIEISNKQGERINIINWAVNKFDSIWNNSYKDTFSKVLSKLFSPFVLALVALLICLCVYFHCKLSQLVMELDLLAIGSFATYIMQGVFRKSKPVIVAVIHAIRNASTCSGG